MDGLVREPQYGQLMEPFAVHSKYLADDALICAAENMEELDSKKLTSEERHAL